MPTRIGFVILSHNNPQQLRRLIRCLQQVYDNPPIAIHHDFDQSSLDRDDFPSDVQFVSPHVKTRWGHFSLVIAALRGLQLLYQKATPDWFFLLSGADYPTMPADKVLKDLASSGMDALLDYREVPNLSDGTLKLTSGLRISKYSFDIGSVQPARSYPVPDNPALKHFVMPVNSALAWRRYIALRLSLPVIRSGLRIGRFMLQLPLEDWRSPFTPDFRCFYGDHWFTGSQKVANILLNPTDNHQRLRRHLRLRHNVDECYYQTVLANTPDLKISKATKRFADWSQSAGGPHGGPSPKVLTLDDLPAIASSKSHFARKFAPESPVLDELDKMLS
jgi:hypothetical protein